MTEAQQAILDLVQAEIEAIELQIAVHGSSENLVLSRAIALYKRNRLKELWNTNSNG